MDNLLNDNKEIWDLFDRDGNRTGETFVRGFGNFRNIPEGRYHLVVDLLVIHTDGTYLLTKRSDTKDVYPGYWEASAGGSAVSGEEPLQAAERELYEETGLRADSLELVGISFRESSHGLYYSYLAKVSGDKDRIVLQDGETTDYKWVDITGFLSYVDSVEAMTAHNLRYESYINRLRQL
jgi:8-oxo-dGTP pyrophosphatase MutT (NUDIX family)